MNSCLIPQARGSKLPARSAQASATQVQESRRPGVPGSRPVRRGVSGGEKEKALWFEARQAEEKPVVQMKMVWLALR